MRMSVFAATAGFVLSICHVPASNAGGLMDRLRSTIKPSMADDVGITWYLRGDLSKSYYAEPTSDYVITFTNPQIGPIDFRNEVIRSSTGAGFGGGLRYRFMRFDVTYEMRNKTPYLGYTPPFNSWSYTGPFPVPARRDRYDLSSRTVLANGYVDLGTYFGITPYIGAGIGATRFNATNYVSEPLPLTAQLGGLTQYIGIGDGKRWSMAWAMMAGIGVSFSHNVKLEAGYRYLHMGTVKFNHADPVTGQIYANVQSKNVRAHEIRVGLRYEFGNPPRAARNTYHATPAPDATFHPTSVQSMGRPL